MINYYNILNLILNFITDKGNKFIGTQGSYKELQPLFKDLSSTSFDFQGPPNRNVISHIVQKCTFPIHSNRTYRLELFAPPTSLHFSVLLS